MRDIDDRDAGLPQMGDNIKELLDVLLLEGLRRLVQKDHARRDDQGASDLDDMTLGEREICDAAKRSTKAGMGRSERVVARLFD